MIEFPYSILVVLLILLVTIFFGMLIYKRMEYAAKWNFIIPDLENRNFKFLRLQRITSIFNPFSSRGDFKNHIDPIFHDTPYNRKWYYYLYYLDANGIERRCTVKVHTILALIVVVNKVEYEPQLGES